MTISSTLARNDYSGSTSTGPYVYAFPITAATDLQVIKRTVGGVETVLTYLTDYTVTGAGNASGGTVTLVSAPLTTDALSIRRNLPLTQPASLRNQGAYFPETIEDQLDRTALVQQQQEDAIARSLKLPPSYNPTGRARHLVPTAGYVVVGDGTGFTTAATSTASAVTLPGAGRTDGTLSAYLANNSVVNVKSYGAVGNGSTDDTVAIKAAIAAVASGAGRTLRFPYGNYKITSVLDFSAWTSYFTGYAVDLDGSTITATGFAGPALRFTSASGASGQELIRVFGGSLQGNSFAGSIGITVDSLQPLGTDNCTFSSLNIDSFGTGMLIGSHTVSANRVAFSAFEFMQISNCLVGVKLAGLVDRCAFRHILTSGCTTAGFQLSEAGANSFEHCTGYGDYPLFLIDGAILETTLLHCQNESNLAAANWSSGTAYVVGNRVATPTGVYTCILNHTNQIPPNAVYWSLVNYYFIKRTATGSGSGGARPMSIIGGTLNAPCLFGPGSAGGTSQPNFFGCTFSSGLQITFTDYYVNLYGCATVAPNGNVLVSGAGSSVTAYGGQVGDVTCSATSAQFAAHDATFGTVTISGGASTPVNVSSKTDVKLRNAQALTARNAGNSADAPLVKLNASDLVEVGGGYAGGYFAQIRGLANASLPAGSAAMNGVVVIDSTNHRIVYYENNLRYFIPIGTAF